MQLIRKKKTKKKYQQNNLFIIIISDLLIAYGHDLLHSVHEQNDLQLDLEANVEGRNLVH